MYLWHNKRLFRVLFRTFYEWHEKFQIFHQHLLYIYIKYECRLYTVECRAIRFRLCNKFSISKYLMTKNRIYGRMKNLVLNELLLFLHMMWHLECSRLHYYLIHIYIFTKIHLICRDTTPQHDLLLVLKLWFKFGNLETTNLTNFVFTNINLIHKFDQNLSTFNCYYPLAIISVGFHTVVIWK